MTQQMDAFLRSFIGYGQDQITNLDIRWETYSDGLITEARAGSPVLVYQALGSSQ
jgi:hypothetical protein